MRARRGARCLLRCLPRRSSRPVRPALPAEPQSSLAPYVPTPQDVVERMLAVAGVGKNDVVVDLGSGDGRLVMTAAKQFGARGIGIDIDPARIAEGRANAKQAGVESLVEFRQQDALQADMSQATVVTLYLLSSSNVKLRPRLLASSSPARASCRTSSAWATGRRTRWKRSPTATAPAARSTCGRWARIRRSLRRIAGSDILHSAILW